MVYICWPSGRNKIQTCDPKLQSRCQKIDTLNISAVGPAPVLSRSLILDFIRGFGFFFNCLSRQFLTQQQYQYYPSISYCYGRFVHLARGTGLGISFIALGCLLMMWQVSRWWWLDGFFLNNFLFWQVVWQLIHRWVGGGGWFGYPSNHHHHHLLTCHIVNKHPNAIKL